MLSEAELNVRGRPPKGSCGATSASPACGPPAPPPPVLEERGVGLVARLGAMIPPSRAAQD